MNTEKNLEYKQILIDNAVCKRRFHLVYEENAKPIPQVQIQCPHCSVVIFDEKNHPEVFLAREENLVYSPKGDYKIISECTFLK